MNLNDLGWDKRVVGDHAWERRVPVNAAARECELAAPGTGKTGREKTRRFQAGTSVRRPFRSQH